ncbi:MAG: hypothetical protein ABSC23_03875 [Bryobacteraceae bacterium]|jgi:hypothetical protein
MKRFAVLFLIVAACLVLAQTSVRPQASVSYTAPVNTAEYTDGFIYTVKDSDEITGEDTAWTSDMTGRLLYTLPCGNIYRFTYVSATSATLDRPYQCDSSSGRRRYNLTQSTYVPGTQHNLGTTAIMVQCFSTGATTQRLMPANVVIYSNEDVEVLWYHATSGACILVR